MVLDLCVVLAADIFTYSSVLMGILKAVYMLTTGGSLDTTFEYWVHFWQK